MEIIIKQPFTILISNGWNNWPFHPQGVILISGARIGYFQGDIRLLMDDLKTLQPTVFPVVPRLLNRMFDKVSF